MFANTGGHTRSSALPKVFESCIYIQIAMIERHSAQPKVLESCVYIERQKERAEV